MKNAPKQKPCLNKSAKRSVKRSSRIHACQRKRSELIDMIIEQQSKIWKGKAARVSPPCPPGAPDTKTCLQSEDLLSRACIRPRDPLGLSASPSQAQREKTLEGSRLGSHGCAPQVTGHGGRDAARLVRLTLFEPRVPNQLKGFAQKLHSIELRRFFPSSQAAALIQNHTETRRKSVWKPWSCPSGNLSMEPGPHQEMYSHDLNKRGRRHRQPAMEPRPHQELYSHDMRGRRRRSS